MADPIDNFLITLQNTAGYMVEPVVCLWYAEQNQIYTERTDYYSKTQTSR